MKPTASRPAVDFIATAWQDEAPDLGVLKRWLHENTRLGPHRVLPEPPRSIRDIYLDTPDLRILRAGFALRIRRTAGSATASLDEPTRLDDGGDRRGTVQPLVSDRVGPSLGERGPVVDRLRVICREDELAVLARIRIERRTYRIVHGSDPSPSAEVALDRSFLTDATGHTHRRTCLNIAVAHAGDPAFRALADRLRGQYGQQGARGAAESAFAWAIRAAGVEVDRTVSLGSGVSGEIEHAMSVRQAADSVLRRYLASFLWHEPGTRLGEDPEQLHDMRVACRRLRAALQLFRPVYPGREADRLRRGLGDFGRRLGEVRDLDVFIDDVGRRCGGLRSADAAAAGPLLLHLERERARARERLRDSLDSADFAALKRDLAALRPCAPAEAAAVDLPRFASRVVRRAHRRVRRLSRGLAPDSPATEFHRLRIAVKRLRYTLGFFEDLYGSAAKRPLASLVDAQDRLGRHQDARIAVDKLRRIVVEDPAGFTPGSWLALGELMQVHRERAKKLRRRLPRRLRRLARKRWRVLGQAMTRLPDGIVTPWIEVAGRENPAAVSSGEAAPPPAALEPPCAGAPIGSTPESRGKTVGH
ncbi:MAG: CHAD domain-containing protein [bacterium]|nr:CHAD domain-containing protein [bacterium]